jgi:ethanolamine utilization microcompartment shell protein EutS
MLCSSPAFAAFRSAGTATSVAVATTSAACGTPAGMVANDIVIEILSSDAAASSPTPPAGFTQIFSDALTLDGQFVRVWWKRAVGGDSLTVTGMSGTASKLLWCFAWSGRDTVNPPVGSTSATNNSANASPTVVTANGVTALANDDLLWLVGLDVTAGGTGTLTVTPTGYTSQGASTDTVDHFDIVAAATKDNVSAGATGTVTGTLTHAGNSGWAAYLIRIPVAGGAGSPAGFNKREKLDRLGI